MWNGKTIWTFNDTALWIRNAKGCLKPLLQSQCVRRKHSRAHKLLKIEVRLLLTYVFSLLQIDLKFNCTQPGNVLKKKAVIGKWVSVWFYDCFSQILCQDLISFYLIYSSFTEIMPQIKHTIGFLWALFYRRNRYAKISDRGNGGSDDFDGKRLWNII